MAVEGKVIAITGASSGIGAAAARSLAASGARVVLGARRRDALAEVVAAIEAAGGEAVATVTDVTRPEDLRRLVELAVDRFGSLDVLVANAGVTTMETLAGGSPAEWDTVIDVNLRGVLHGIAAALPVFTERGAGQFVTVTSTSSIKWLPRQGVYAATKAGVRALCDILRQEVGPAIRVSTVCPGATATDFGSDDPETMARIAHMRMDPSAVADAIAYVIDQPDGVNIGEVVVRSAAQP